MISNPPSAFPRIPATQALPLKFVMPEISIHSSHLLAGVVPPPKRLTSAVMLADVAER